MIPVGFSKSDNPTALEISTFHDQWSAQRFWAEYVHIVLPFNMTGLASKSLFDGLSLRSMSSKKAAMGIDPNAVTQTPTSSKLDVSSATFSSPLLTISPNQ
jgi:hypothetical protein